jgi:hypothetical protein
MNLLHLIFTFNLVTAIFILLGAYYLHFRYDEDTNGTADTKRVYDGGSHSMSAGIVGALVSVTLLSGVATLFA